MNAPTVTVMIPTFNRIDDLAKALQKVKLVQYAPLDVLVVDDGSEDAVSVQSVVLLYGARYLRTPRNIGLIAARNFGLKSCASKYVVNLDDDSWFQSPDGLQVAIEFMESNQDVAVLALNIETSKGKDWSENCPPVRVPYYTGCGNIYRRADVTDSGPYIEEFVRQGEEAERSLRLYAKGLNVVALPRVGVYHAQSPVNRNSVRAVTYEVINYLRREVLRAPLILVAFGALRSLIYGGFRIHLVDKKLFQREVFGINSLPKLWRTHRNAVPVFSYVKWQLMAWRFNRRAGKVDAYLERYSTGFNEG